MTKRIKLDMGCPRCGTPWKRESGLRVCSNARCGHREGSGRVWENYSQRSYAGGGYLRQPNDPHRMYDGPSNPYPQNPRGELKF